MKRLIIEIEYPSHLNAGDVIDYAEKALGSWGGGLHPDDYFFFGLKIKTVLVPFIKRLPQ